MISDIFFLERGIGSSLCFLSKERTRKKERKKTNKNLKLKTLSSKFSLENNLKVK